MVKGWLEGADVTIYWAGNEVTSGGVLGKGSAMELDAKAKERDASCL
jgi:hypothetical protein